jgi:hypothetical protein
MRYRTYFACMVLVAVLTGCSNENTESRSQEPKEAAVHVRQTETEVPAADKSLKIEFSLSTNTVVVDGNVSMTANLVNTGKANVALDRNALSVWLSVTDTQHQSIGEIPFMDEIHAPGKASRLVVPSGGSKVVRVFGAQVTKGSWKGFGTSGKYEGVGLVVHRDAGASCYPLKDVPGEYFLRCHLRAGVAGAGTQPAIEIVSDKVKVFVTK